MKAKQDAPAYVPFESSAEQVNHDILVCTASIRNPNTAIRVWEEILTDADRKALGNNLPDTWKTLGTAGMYMQVRGVPKIRAILDLAYQLDFLTEHRYRWLLRETGQELIPDRRRRLPSWDRKTGKFYFGKKLLCRFRLRLRPTLIQQILDSFQDAGWITPIINPIADKRTYHGVHQVLRHLNRRSKKVRFHSQKGAKSLSWSISSKSQ